MKNSPVREDGETSVWYQDLLLLQLDAPHANMIACKKKFLIPTQFGEEYHGVLTKVEVEELFLDAKDGSYLVRDSLSSPFQQYVLCIKFNGNQDNYKMFYDDGKFYVEKDRVYDTVEMLVEDGLISRTIQQSKKMNRAEVEESLADSADYKKSPHYKFVKAKGIMTQEAHPHNFHPNTFVFHHCDYCRNFLSGIIYQGLRCSSCGFAAHRRCAERTPATCIPDDSYVHRVFSIDLTTWCLAHGFPMPEVVRKCILQVSARGLTEKGIYRVEGAKSEVNRLISQFDNREDVDLSETPIHVVSNLLKRYLRSLPLSLIPIDLHSALENAYKISDNSRRIRAIRKSLVKLSEANKITLDNILDHLRHVASHQDENQMSLYSLVTIFSPTIFSSPADVTKNQIHTSILAFMIQNPSTTSTSVPPPDTELSDSVEEKDYSKYVSNLNDQNTLYAPNFYK